MVLLDQRPAGVGDGGVEAVVAALRVGVALTTVVHKVQVKVICHHHTAESAPR